MPKQEEKEIVVSAEDEQSQARANEELAAAKKADMVVE